jgi:hypothetical protein
MVRIYNLLHVQEKSMGQFAHRLTSENLYSEPHRTPTAPTVKQKAAPDLQAFNGLRLSHPLSAETILQLQRTIGNQAVIRLLTKRENDPSIQRLVEYDQKAKAYIGNETRPPWQQALKKYVIDKYNEGKPANERLSYETNLSLEGLDRCHKVSFSDIQRQLLIYLNSKPRTKGEDYQFDKFTDGLFNESDKAVGQKKKMQAARYKMRICLNYTPPDYKGVVGHANSLLSYLNSAIGNVLLGDASINRGIQDDLDLHFEETPGGHFSMTPDSRGVVTESAPTSSSVATTPRGEHFRSSTSGDVPVADLSPRTARIVYPHLPDHS